VYLALLEFGTQPASIIAKKAKLPRSTVLFLFEELLEKGYIRKTQKGRTQYFYADPRDLEKIEDERLKQARSNLCETIPLLKEFKSPFSSPPKITFFEGINGCRKAYLILLESKTEILEFSTHGHLLKMGEKFMDDFIDERARRKIMINVILQESELERSYTPLNKKQFRKIKFFSPEIGSIYSAIDVYEDKVLLLNLHSDAFGILIQSKEFAETMKTIFNVMNKSL